MSQRGIMAEIRALLAQEKSPKEIIILGYNPPPSTEPNSNWKKACLNQTSCHLKARPRWW